MLSLGVQELLELEEALLEELPEHITAILSNLNRQGQLELFLELLGMEELIQPDKGYVPYKDGKIVVIGAPKISSKNIYDVGKALGIEKDRFELHLEYDDVKKFDCRKMQYNPNYGLVMFGPTPHSGASKGDAGSVIAAIEDGDGYPPVVRLGTNGLKITRSNFKEMLKEAIEKGIINI